MSESVPPNLRVLLQNYTGVNPDEVGPLVLSTVCDAHV